MKIVIQEKKSQQPNGDRDTNRHPCSGFVVLIHSNDLTMVVFENDQFDNFYCHIDGSRTSYLNEAQKFALELGVILGCEAELEPLDTLQKREETLLKYAAGVDQDEETFFFYERQCNDSPCGTCLFDKRIVELGCVFCNVPRDNKDD